MSPPPGCRPLFFKPKYHKESQNGFKPINFRSPMKVIFSNYFFRHQKSSKQFDILLIFEILSQYMCISKTSSKKNDFRTSRICWKITKIWKTLSNNKPYTHNRFGIGIGTYRITSGLLILRVFNTFVIFQQILEVLKSFF